MDGEKDRVALSVNGKISVQSNGTADSVEKLLEPFQFEGSVSESENDESVCLRIQRDTAVSQSVIERKAVPFLDMTLTGEHTILRGLGKEPLLVPLCRLYLKSDLVEKYVTVVVCDEVPVSGVAFLLGNDIAGKLVVSEPIVTLSPMNDSPTTDLENKFPKLFPSCTVTRSQSLKLKNLKSENEVKLRVGSKPKNTPEEDVSQNLSDLFAESVVNSCPNTESVQSEDEGEGGDVRVRSVKGDESLISSSSSGEGKNNCGNYSDGIDFGKLPITRDVLIKAQKADPHFQDLFSIAVNEDECLKEKSCFFIRDDLLMRKFCPPDVPAVGSDAWVYQVVTPSVFTEQIIGLAHDYHGGHLGVRKTKDKILRNFFWPKISKSVAKYCRECHIWQMSGKPN